MVIFYILFGVTNLLCRHPSVLEFYRRIGLDRIGVYIRVDREKSHDRRGIPILTFVYCQFDFCFSSVIAKIHNNFSLSFTIANSP